MADIGHEKCFRDEDFRKLGELVSTVFKKMDKFVEEMRDVMISEAVRQEQFNQVDRELAEFKKDIKEVKREVKAISDWRQRFDGAFKVMMAIPVGCAVITTAIAVYKLLGG